MPHEADHQMIDAVLLNEVDDGRDRMAVEDVRRDVDVLHVAERLRPLDHLLVPVIGLLSFLNDLIDGGRQHR